MRINKIAAIIYVTIGFVVVLFQLLLALGMPFGELVLGGGTPGVLSKSLRWAELIQAVIICLCSIVVLSRSEIAFLHFQNISKKLIWIVVGVAGLSFILNLITQSEFERNLWAPVALAMLITSIIVAR
ncbi:MAG: hypothetical protein ABL927_00475 [Bdellovibrionales bacterium]